MLRKSSDLFVQVAVPCLTILGQVAVALKYPQWGLLINILAQPFWIYSSYQAYKKAGQTGMFITTIILTVIMIFGVINYWLIN